MVLEKGKTYYIVFTERMPKKFVLVNSGTNKLYFFRYLDGKTPRIKFNILHTGDYYSNVPFKVVKQTAIEIPEKLPDLPSYERDKIKDFVIVDNFTLLGTPARNFSDLGIIEKGVNFYRYPEPIRCFILLHEIGHFYYKTEEKCDLFALVHFLKMGHNRSMAFYALSKVLKRTPENMNRLKSLLNNIQKTQDGKL